MDYGTEQGALRGCVWQVSLEKVLYRIYSEIHPLIGNALLSRKKKTFD